MVKISKCNLNSCCPIAEKRKCANSKKTSGNTVMKSLRRGDGPLTKKKFINL